MMKKISKHCKNGSARCNLTVSHVYYIEIQPEISSIVVFLFGWDVVGTEYKTILEIQARINSINMIIIEEI